MTSAEALKLELINFWHLYYLSVNGELIASPRWKKSKAAFSPEPTAHQKKLIAQTMKQGKELSPGLELWVIHRDGRLLITTACHVATAARRSYVTKVLNKAVTNLPYIVIADAEAAHVWLNHLYGKWK